MVHRPSLREGECREKFVLSISCDVWHGPIKVNCKTPLKKDSRVCLDETRRIIKYGKIKQLND